METAERARLNAVLLSAFTIDELRRLVRYTLNLDMDAISSGNLEERVFEVVEHAERTDRLAELIAGAVKVNPGNEQIQTLVADAIAAGLDKKQHPNEAKHSQMDEQRLDTLIGQVGEMRGEMRAMSLRMRQLEATVERIAQVHTGSLPTHYWTTIVSFIIVAVVIAAMIFWSGIPR